MPYRACLNVTTLPANCAHQTELPQLVLNTHTYRHSGQEGFLGQVRLWLLSPGRGYKGDSAVTHTGAHHTRLCHTAVWDTTQTGKGMGRGGTAWLGRTGTQAVLAVELRPRPCRDTGPSAPHPHPGLLMGQPSGLPAPPPVLPHSGPVPSLVQ